MWAAAGFWGLPRLAEREGLLGPSWASPLALLGARFQRSRFAPCKSVEPVWVEGSNPSRESLRSTLFRRGGLVFGFLRLAEREGFEPSIRETRIPDFESGAFDHSATSPQITATGVGQFPSGAFVRLIHETLPSRCSGPAIRLSKFAPGELVDHSATSPQITATGVGQFPSGACCSARPGPHPSALLRGPLVAVQIRS